MMSKHRVKVAFTDAKDNRHTYKAGDAFPRPHAKKAATTTERIAELMSDKNARLIPLIEVVEEEPTGNDLEEQQQDDATQDVSELDSSEE